MSESRGPSRTNKTDEKGVSFRDRRYWYNSEFEKFENEFQYRNGQINFVNTIEIEKDLFRMSDDYSLGHCMADDMRMTRGIAVHFRYRFKKVNQLLNQRQEKGGLAVLKDHHRWIYYLVTKQLSSGKPTYSTLFSSLQKMKKHVIRYNVQKLALPRIGCGLDRLSWDKVKFMIEYVFTDVNIKIVICNFCK